MERTKLHVPSLTPALRDTGISFLGEVPWGTHLCLFYETKEDLLDTAVAYFKSGLKSNEFMKKLGARSLPELVRVAIVGPPGDDALTTRARE